MQFAVEKLDIIDITQPEKSEFRQMVSTHEPSLANLQPPLVKSGSTAAEDNAGESAVRDFILIRFTHHYHAIAGAAVRGGSGRTSVLSEVSGNILL